MTRPKMRDLTPATIEELRKMAVSLADQVEAYERPVDDAGDPTGPDFEDEDYFVEIGGIVMRGFYGEGYWDWHNGETE